MSEAHHLAQLNVATPRAPIESAEMAEFAALLARVLKLRAEGPTPAAFTFRDSFEPVGTPAG